MNNIIFSTDLLIRLEWCLRNCEERNFITRLGEFKKTRVKDIVALIADFYEETIAFNPMMIAYLATQPESFMKRVVNYESTDTFKYLITIDKGNFSYHFEGFIRLDERYIVIVYTDGTIIIGGDTTKYKRAFLSGLRLYESLRGKMLECSIRE